jgi:hypothetical protein
VEHEPHRAALVGAQLEEVVAAAECPELLGCLLAHAAVAGPGRDTMRSGEGAPVGILLRVPVAEPGGDALRPPVEERIEIVREVVGPQGGLGGDDPAADVHPDR